ncbi:MAG: glycerophosphodiester phosphodiesterase [Candidatus Latescibacterota bacterium]|jgi:glycerophosphoryl diester phosphodiesterase
MSVAVYAHRGASGTHPENTEAAFVEALRLGVEAVELDVHLSLDQELVVIHDDTVDRTSDGSGQVRHMKWEQIGALDAGSWFDARFAGQRFLKLDEALDILEGDVRLNVHAKAHELDRAELATRVVRRLVDRKLLQRAFFASDQQTLALARRVNQYLTICNLSVEPLGNYILRSCAIGAEILQPGHGVTTPELVAAAHNKGMQVNPFYADEEGEMQRLIDCGVDGILTNYPEKLQTLLRSPKASNTNKK